jgi:hypothetical protein
VMCGRRLARLTGDLHEVTHRQTRLALHLTACEWNVGYTARGRSELLSWLLVSVRV